MSTTTSIVNKLSWISHIWSYDTFSLLHRRGSGLLGYVYVRRVDYDQRIQISAKISQSEIERQQSGVSRTPTEKSRSCVVRFVLWVQWELRAQNVYMQLIVWLKVTIIRCNEITYACILLCNNTYIISKEKKEKRIAITATRQTLNLFLISPLS